MTNAPYYKSKTDSTIAKMLRACLFFVIICCAVGYEYTLLGCFKDLPTLRTLTISNTMKKDQCLRVCYEKYYRYSYIYQIGQCICGNYLGEQVSNVTCSECDTCDRQLNLLDIYATGNLVPGPPRNFTVSNITETSVRLTWQEPESFVELTSYQIKPTVLKTYSSFPIYGPNYWTYPNNTFQTELITLLPGTKYNISLSTNSPYGNGASVYLIITTKIADPDNLPSQPKIVSRDGSKMKIRMMSTSNNNGPVTSYRVIVVDEDNKQAFDKDNVFAYDEAKRNGLSYYVAAELDPNDIDKEFTVGDGRKYKGYHNVPLDPSVNYDVLLGVVSKLNGITKMAYSDASGSRNGVLILNVNPNGLSGDSPAVIIGLSIAIGLLSFMLVAGIFVFIILKSRVVNRRQRLSDNQELTLQGPMIEVENNGYIHEEDHLPVNHYRRLKQKVHTIPSNQLKIEPTNLLGIGRYGRVNSGTVHENNTLTPVAVYSIQDKKMSQETKRAMLQDLDVLIKVGKHENLIGLIGTCETSQVVCVILDYVSMNLKDLLLGSRDSLPGRFSNMSETQALEIAVQVAKGMAFLESCKIVHKQLCARSVMISNGFTPKISNYGIAQYFSHNKIPDYTRWTALEVFKGQAHTVKSDVWSFACLLWEICVLGGTPYGNTSNNNEISEKVIKGLRLPQLQYISDDLYQIMLDCWQLDSDERPKFSDLVDSIANLKDNNLYLSFNIFPNFQYEQFYPDMEIAVRPVF